jgi:hypothetical protein
MVRELWRKSCCCWCYLQLADPAKIGKEATNLQSLTKMLARICFTSGIPVHDTTDLFGKFISGICHIGMAAFFLEPVVPVPAPSKDA